MIIIKPKYAVEVFDRLTGANYSGQLEISDGYQTTVVGAQDQMYKFFEREFMSEDEIEEMERHRT